MLEQRLKMQARRVYLQFYEIIVLLISCFFTANNLKNCKGTIMGWSCSFLYDCWSKCSCGCCSSCKDNNNVDSDVKTGESPIARNATLDGSKTNFYLVRHTSFNQESLPTPTLQPEESPNESPTEQTFSLAAVHSPQASSRNSTEQKLSPYSEHKEAITRTPTQHFIDPTKSSSHDYNEEKRAVAFLTIQRLAIDLEESPLSCDTLTKDQSNAIKTPLLSHLPLYNSITDKEKQLEEEKLFIYDYLRCLDLLGTTPALQVILNTQKELHVLICTDYLKIQRLKFDLEAANSDLTMDAGSIGKKLVGALSRFNLLQNHQTGKESGEIKTFLGNYMWCLDLLTSTPMEKTLQIIRTMYKDNDDLHKLVTQNNKLSPLPQPPKINKHTASFRMR